MQKNWSKPVKTGYLRQPNQLGPVLIGSVAVSPKMRNRNRGCGCRLPILKNRTEPDLQTLLTPEHSQMWDVGFGAVQHLKWRTPCSAFYWCPIIDMNGEFYGEFPVRLRKTSLKAKCLGFLYQSPIQVFSTPILLMHVGDACLGSYSQFFEFIQ